MQIPLMLLNLPCIHCIMHGMPLRLTYLQADGIWKVVNFRCVCAWCRAAVMLPAMRHDPASCRLIFIACSGVGPSHIFISNAPIFRCSSSFNWHHRRHHRRGCHWRCRYLTTVSEIRYIFRIHKFNLYHFKARWRWQRRFSCISQGKNVSDSSSSSNSSTEDDRARRGAPSSMPHSAPCLNIGPCHKFLHVRLAQYANRQFSEMIQCRSECKSFK